MASNIGKTPLTARQLLQKRTDFNRKFFNSFQYSKKCAHEAIEKAQADYDRRLKVLQDKLIKQSVKQAGKPDSIHDPELLKYIQHTRVVDRLDDDKKPIFKYEICQLKPHVALALARNPDSADVPLSQSHIRHNNNSARNG